MKNRCSLFFFLAFLMPFSSFYSQAAFGLQCIDLFSQELRVHPSLLEMSDAAPHFQGGHDSLGPQQGPYLRFYRTLIQQGLQIMGRQNFVSDRWLELMLLVSRERLAYEHMSVNPADDSFGYYRLGDQGEGFLNKVIDPAAFKNNDWGASGSGSISMERRAARAGNICGKVAELS